MKIAYFCPHSDPLAQPGEPDAGGQCVYEAEVTRALAGQGHSVRCFTRAWGDKPPRENVCDGGEVHRIPMGPQGFLRKEEMGPHLAEFVANTIAAHGDWLAKCDLVHGHYWDGGVSGLGAALAFGKPLAFTSHSLGALKQARVPDPDGQTFNYPLRLAAEGRVLRSADLVVATSQVEVEAIHRDYHCTPLRVRVVPAGVDVHRFAPATDRAAVRSALGVEADWLLFTVGRLDPRKGFLELINALPPLKAAAAKSGRRVRIMMPAGPQRPSDEEQRYLAQLRDRAASLGVTELIHWFHRLDDQALLQAYQAADLFVCPSPYEPFGMVIVEALACGTPAVATCHGGPPEILTPGVDGELADPGDPEAFGAALVAILDCSADAQAMRRSKARNTAVQRFSWEAVSDQLLSAYSTLNSTLG